MSVATGDRAGLLSSATRLGRLSLGWNVAEGVVAVWFAWLAGSRALAGFGLDSAVESVSAAVLLWRLRAERLDPERADRVERQALKAIGVGFLLLAAYVGFEAVRALVLRHEPDESIPGIVLTALSLLVMPWLARRKRAVARALGSAAAEADSTQTFVCAWLSAVVLAGLALNAAFGWWWADPVAALAAVAFLVKEGRDALRAEHAGDCC